MIEASVWAVPPLGAEAPLPPQVDVAVIGAGITGLAAAIALRERGASVAVLEGRTAGFGASARNGGMALTGLKLAPQTLIERYGLDAARAMFRASLDALDLLERTIERYGIACDFARSGHLEVAAKPAHAAHFAQTAQILEQRFGHRVRTLTRDELHEEIESEAYYGGLLDERSAALDPGRYVGGLAQAASRLGAAVCESAPVARVERRANGWTLHAGRGEIAATHVLAATGAYAGPPLEGLRRRLVRVGSYAVATQALPNDLAARLIPRNRMIFDSKRLLHYFRRTPGERLLFGGRAAFVPESGHATAKSAAILQRDLAAVFPQLGDVAIEYAWGGTLDLTFDVMPHAGELDGLAYAVGYAGHGVALATLLGTLSAHAIVDGSAKHPFGAELPRVPLGLYDGRAWFLPLVGAWQRLLDRVS